MVAHMTIDALRDAGFDIAHPFDAQAASCEPGWAILAGAQQRGILIGNTRALWPVFTAAMNDPALAALRDPLDHYTETAIATAFPCARVYYSHRRYDAGYLPFQKLAVAIGLGALSEGGLVIHPEYGPWLALRAVLVIDGEPVARTPIAKPCTCGARCAETLELALAGGDWRAWLAVRDACSLRRFRYSETQARYHYTKAWVPGDLPVEPDP